MMLAPSVQIPVFSMPDLKATTPYDLQANYNKEQQWMKKPMFLS